MTLEIAMSIDELRTIPTNMSLSEIRKIYYRDYIKNDGAILKGDIIQIDQDYKKRCSDFMQKFRARGWRK